jgi:uncharacterized membrane protein
VLKGAARAGFIVQSLFYVATGVNHFWHEHLYLHIMPDHYTHPLMLIQLSGAAEILGGLGLLLPLTQRFSAVGIAIMLVIFFDVHIFMLRHPARFPEVPAWLLWARIPLQFLLIAWALYYARRDGHSPAEA